MCDKIFYKDYFVFGKVCCVMDNEFEKENINVDGDEPETEEITVEKRKGTSMKKEIMEWIVAIVIAFVVAFIIRTFFFNFVAVSGGSMDDTLHNGQRLVVSRFNYTPKQGDIIVFTPDMHPDTPYIKRVIATEGQTVDIDSRGIVYVDGKVLDEDYIKNTTTLNGDVQFPITVPEDCVFVMGDNRQGSHDGRSLDVSSVVEKPDGDDLKTKFKMYNEKTQTLEIHEEYLYYGCVHKDDVMGKAVFRFWPMSKFGTLK